MDVGRRYSEDPVALDAFALTEWDEFLHYLYLPIHIPDRPTVFFLPRRLEFLRPLVLCAMVDAPDSVGCYVYITARRGYATPENPLNRPGWHCDGFGTDDLNYVWWDRWGTRFAHQEFDEISADHGESMRQFEEQVRPDCIEIHPDRWLYRLTPYVVHNTPVVPAGGGMRSFLKISISRHRYNLIGNSHNHLFDYAWKMWPRDVARNDPAHGMVDFYQDPE